MNTFRYKGGYIHENFETGEVKAQLNDSLNYELKSVHAAKIWITKQWFIQQENRTVESEYVNQD